MLAIHILLSTLWDGFLSKIKGIFRTLEVQDRSDFWFVLVEVVDICFLRKLLFSSTDTPLGGENQQQEVSRNYLESKESLGSITVDCQNNIRNRTLRTTELMLSIISPNSLSLSPRAPFLGNWGYPILEIYCSFCLRTCKSLFCLCSRHT